MCVCSFAELYRCIWRETISLSMTLCSLPTAPPGMPVNFAMVAEGPQNITFSWVMGSPGIDSTDLEPNEGQQEDLQNAPIGYIISCTPQPIAFPYSLSIASNATSRTVKHTLGEFEPGTDYSCDLRAYNGAGMGHEASAAAKTPGNVYTCAFTSNKYVLCEF